MAKAYKLGQLAIDNTEVVKLKNDFVKYANKDVLKALTAFHREISKEVMDEVGNHDDYTKKIYKSYYTFLKKVRPWTKISELAYLEGNN